MVNFTTDWPEAPVFDSAKYSGTVGIAGTEWSLKPSSSSQTGAGTTGYVGGGNRVLVVTLEDGDVGGGDDEPATLVETLGPPDVVDPSTAPDVHAVAIKRNASSPEAWRPLSCEVLCAIVLKTDRQQR